jgi:hypothetical protein
MMNAPEQMEHDGSMGGHEGHHGIHGS